MKKIKISIRRSAVFILMATATFSIFSINALWIFTEIKNSKRELAEIKDSYESRQRELLKDKVKKVISLIDYSRKYNSGKSTVELQDGILDHVSSMRFGSGGYVFINTYDGRALIFDGVRIIGEKNIRNITDPDGLKIFETELNTINNSDGGYFKYKFKRMDTFHPEPKLSYVFGHDDWKWIIGAGIYLDDISLFVINARNQYQATLFKKVLYIILLFVVLLFVLIGVAMFLSGFIRKEFAVFMSFFSKSPDKNKIIDREKLHIEEFKELAHSANIMIEQRGAAEKLLKKERDKAHKYLNVAGVIILTLDTNGNVALINKKGCETLGYDEEDIIGKNWFGNFVPLADKQSSSTKFSRALYGNNKLKFNDGENRIVTKSGQEKIISWQNTQLLYEDGTISGTLSSGQDITESKSVKDSFFESEEKYRLLFEKTSDPVLIIGKKNTFIDCNHAAVKMLGLRDRNELTGTHPDKISPDRQPDGKLSIIKASEMIAKARREGFHRFEWLHLNKNKKPFHVDVSLTVIPISGIEYLYVVWRNISDKKKQYEELMVAKEKAEQSDDIKTSFLHNMQHEIRTPLNAMMGFSQLLKQQGHTADEAEAYCEAIISSGNQLNKIIDEIIDFSRLQAGYIFITNETTELKKLLTGIFKEHYPAIHNKSVNFTISTCPSNNNTIIETDVKRLKQIIGHLINNAFKFTKKGTVELGYIISGNDVKFYVIDTGVGIEKQHFKTIFERFNRVTHKNPEKLYGGNGLGLSISKAVLGFLGGRIWVESEIGRGSKFSFTIPYKPLEISNKIENGSLRGSNISVVTNNKSTFELISNAVRKTGADLIHIKSGMDAIEFCQKDYKTDLMIMDLNLTGMNGIVATKAIKAFKKELPIIALIANEQKNRTKEDALIAGCDDYITIFQTEKTIELMLSLYLDTDILAYAERMDN